MGVPQYTTPTFTLIFDEPGLNLSEASEVYVTFLSNGTTVTKTGNDITVYEKSIEVFLSQSDTSKFHGVVEIQANWLADGKRAASNVVQQIVDRQLLQRIIGEQEQEVSE